MGWEEGAWKEWEPEKLGESWVRVLPGLPLSSPLPLPPEPYEQTTLSCWSSQMVSSFGSERAWSALVTAVPTSSQTPQVECKPRGASPFS